MTKTRSKAYSSQLRETTLDSLAVTGEIPAWLSGNFVSNGPAQFEIGTTHFNHWFDGFAMLKRFDFKSGKVSFQNRFLRSEQYVKSYAANKLYTNEFGTYASPSLLGRIKQSLGHLKNSETYDNCNVNTARIADHFIAMSESADVIEFNLSDLSTVGAFKFNDTLQGHLQLAHPHWDIHTGETLNILTEFGKEIKYHIYKIAPNSTRREIIKTYISKTAFYMHSFSITKNYVILFKTPLVINLLKSMLGLPFNHCLAWQKKLPSFFVVIDRRDGTVREIETDTFVCLHSANAYESGDEVILDLICYQEGNPYNQEVISNLTREHPKYSHPNLQRYRIDLKTHHCRKEILITDPVEFPRLNYPKINGGNYTFLYMTAMTSRDQKAFNALQKINVQTGQSQHFEKANNYFGEPVFVPKPDSTIEDEGILLSIIFNIATECSSLIILDAHSMQQIAEIALPFHLPFGLHGNFVS